MTAGNARRWAKLKATLVVVTSLSALGGIGFGIHCAVNSDLFLIRVVEVADQPEDAPVDASAISTLANVPVDRLNLFQLDLRAVEQRVLTHPWIREVHLTKRFPQTVSITVTFREPRALLQLEGGALAYVDTDGKVFGRANLSQRPDLPILAGLQEESHHRIAEALLLLDTWTKAQPDGHGDLLPQLASLSYDTERGYRALVSYPLSRPGQKSAARARTMVDLGHDFDAEFGSQLGRLRGVFRYLADNGIAVRQIWADSGKKIVVKIARGS